MLTPQQYGFYLTRLGSAAGFKERLAYYCNGRQSQCSKEGADFLLYYVGAREEKNSQPRESRPATPFTKETPCDPEKEKGEDAKK